MEVLKDQLNSIAGGDCQATIVLNLPTNSSRAFNNLMIGIAAGVTITADDVITSIDALQNLQGQSFEDIKVVSILYENFRF